VIYVATRTEQPRPVKVIMIEDYEVPLGIGGISISIGDSIE